MSEKSKKGNYNSFNSQ